MKLDSLILFEQNPKLFNNEMYLVADGVDNVADDKPFQILVSNFGSTQIELCPIPYNQLPKRPDTVRTS